MLVIYFILFVVISYFTIKLIYKAQKNVLYIKPGWFIVGLTIFYILPTVSLHLIDTSAIYKNFQLQVSNDIILLCLEIFLFSMLGFFSAEVVLNNRRSGIHSQQNKCLIDVYKYLHTYNPQILIIAFVLISLSIILYFERWANIGGFWKMVEIGRAEALFDLQINNSNFIRYDIPLFLGTSFFVPTILINGFKKSIISKIIIIELIFITTVIFISGARLPVISLIILAGCSLYYLKRNWIASNMKKAIFMCISLFLTLNLYTYFRSNMWEILNKSDSNEYDVSIIQTVFPSEILTAVNALSKMEQSPNLFYDNQFTKFIPNTFRPLFGLGEFIPYSARLQYYTNSRSTLTVPFPIDSYYGLNESLIFLFIYSFLFYFLIEKMIILFSKNKFGLFYILWVQIILYYMIRTESIAWSSRLSLMFIIGIPCITLLKILKRNKV